MNHLWPRLPAPTAEALLADFKNKMPLPTDTHEAQVFAPVGGTRAAASDIQCIRAEMERVAIVHGYPNAAPDAARIAFDRDACFALHAQMPMTWSEAASRDVWSFLALVALPHLTDWRFGISNRERWIGSDLTRHTWARLWWHAVVFAGEPELLGKLTEGDLNQLLERRSIGGNPRLAQQLARAITESVPAGAERRQVMRDVAARLRRRLAFTETLLVQDEDLQHLVDALIEESRRY